MKIALPLLLAMAACATAKPPAWVPAEGKFIAATGGFELEGPPGWMRRNNPESPEVFVVTRDGTALQRILARATPVGQPLGLGGSKRPVAAGMSPVELGELVAEDLRSAEGFTEFSQLSSTATPVCGRDGFRLLARFRDDGLAKRADVVGALDGGRLTWILYVAPERVYYPLDLPIFDRVVGSCTLRTPAPAPKPAASPSS
jgi:hypothetical protein